MLAIIAAVPIILTIILTVGFNVPARKVLLFVLLFAEISLLFPCQF